MMHLKVEWKQSCPKHPRYNPAYHGQMGIRGGCEQCQRLFDKHFAITKYAEMQDGKVLTR